MRLLILLLAIVIGNARGRECTWNTQADYSVANNVLTFKNECTSIGPVNNNCYGFPSGVTSVVLQQGLQRVGRYAFYRCGGLTSVTFPEGLQQVGDAAFYGCSNLTSVTFPDSMTTIAENAFKDCSSITSLSFSTLQQMIQFNALLVPELNPNIDFKDVVSGSLYYCQNFVHNRDSSGGRVSSEERCADHFLSATQATFNPNIAYTIRGLNPCTEGNYHSDACKNKIAEEYSQTQFIDLYNRNYTSTCS